MKGMDESINESALGWFGHIKRMIGFLKEYMWESVSVVAWYFDCRRGALIQ